MKRPRTLDRPECKPVIRHPNKTDNYPLIFFGDGGFSRDCSTGEVSGVVSFFVLREIYLKY